MVLEQVSFRASAELRCELEKIAKKESRTLSNVITLMLTNKVRAYNKSKTKSLK